MKIRIGVTERQAGLHLCCLQNLKTGFLTSSRYEVIICGEERQTCLAASILADCVMCLHFFHPNSHVLRTFLEACPFINHNTISVLITSEVEASFVSNISY